MHKEPLQFVASVKAQYPDYFTGKKVLEVGSLDINGSVRKFFENCDYTGIDLGEGRGVDVIAKACDFIHPETYDIVISTEMLEHDSLWQLSLKAMHKNLKSGGLLLITCAAPNRPEHGTTRTGSEYASPFTSDYYRNISVEDFASILPANLFSKSYLGYRGDMDDLYFAGIKATKNPFVEYSENMLREMARLTSTATEFASPPIQLLDLGMGRDLIEPHGGAMGTISVDAENKSATVNLVSPKPLTVTAEVSTLNRYETTLPMCISAILMQTHKPDKLVIYDDGEQKELKDTPPFDGLLQLALDNFGIQWVYYSTERKGQVANHQHALDSATTDLIWRIDDDEIPEPNCLENLLTEMKEGVGAVAGLVHHPRNVAPLPDHVTGTIADIALGTNIQWFDWGGEPREVEHLYSTFLYSVDAARKAGGYPKELSAVGHREESWFTIKLRQAGYKLIVTPKAKTWHLRQSSGGIRSFSDTSLWENDDQLFQAYLKTLGQVLPAKDDLKVLDCGIGDTLLFRALLVDEFHRKWPERKWRLAVCYPECFADLDYVEILSIAEAKLIVGDRYQSEYSLFDYGWHHGNGRNILDVMREFYAK